MPGPMDRLCKLRRQSSNWLAWQLAQPCGASETPCAAIAADSGPCGASGLAQWPCRKRTVSASADDAEICAAAGAGGVRGSGPQPPRNPTHARTQNHRLA